MFLFLGGLAVTVGKCDCVEENLYAGHNTDGFLSM
jgi:hypothetical protein